MGKLSFKDVLPLTGSSHTMPHIGFGVFRSDETTCKASCLSALKLGYRHIDTAQYYENEVQVGEAVRESGLPRESVYVTTKIMQPVGSVEKSLQALRESVGKIGLGYVDLFLIHSPSSGKEGRKELWTALEELKKQGGTKDIGVSNFGVKHLEQLREFSSTTPVVNQIELHPWCQQREVVDYCKKNGIVVQAYAPLVRAQKNDDPTLQSIAEAHGVSVPQVLVRWSLQHGFVPLPKSDNPDRIKSNVDVYDFELTDEEIKKIDDKVLPDEEGAICPYLGNCP
ncbi:NADP-dependent oxidoreductase domain-containing protein [Morchella snyderi]|nr:NADP-dependent oxidoreductase domain-containing protein [Morchella snyderi]